MLTPENDRLYSAGLGSSREPQIDVLRYSKQTSWILNVSVFLNLLLALGVLAVAGIVYKKFREPPIIVQQDHGHLQAHAPGLFILQTHHVQAFLDRTLGKLRSYSQDKPDYSDIEDLVDEKVIYGIEKEAKEHIDAARKFNRRQMWTLSGFRRYYDRKYGQMIALAVQGNLTNYENSKITAKVHTVEVKMSKDYLIVYLVRVPLSKKNPWGLALVDIQAEGEASKFEKVWKESYDPYGPEFDPKNEDTFEETFQWKSDWKPRHKKSIEK